jgi:hypothetical protein
MTARMLLALLTVFVVLPAGATAVNSPELTYPTGTRLALETKLKGTNVGELKFTGSSGTVGCTSAALTGTLAKNNGSEVEASLNGFSLTGSGTEGRCTGAPAETYVSINGSCLRSTPEFIEHEFQLRGGACSEAHGPLIVTFKALTAVLECVYERSAAVTGTFSTHPADALLTASPEFVKASGSFLCYSAFKIDSSFTFERSETGVKPLYISAGPTLTFPTGAKLATEAKVRGRSVGNITLTSVDGKTSLLTCSAGETIGTLRKNNGTEIEVDIESAAFGGTGTEETCTSELGNTKWTFNSATNGLPWCLRATSAMASDEFQIRGNSCSGASRSIRVIAETTAAATTCVYERQAAITGTYKTHPEDARLDFANAVLLEKEPRSGACVDETTMDASFTLERDEAGTNPTYIS